MPAMRTSLNDIALAERLLSGQLLPGDQQLAEAKQLLDHEWKAKLFAQQQVYRLIKLYGREQLRAEIAAIGEKLLHAPEHAGFREKLRRIFFHSKK